MFPVWAGFLLLVCYLLGSFRFGQWVAKYMAGVDLTKRGSGNTGAANALRALGWKGGLMVLALDILKGTLAVGLAWFALLPGFLLMPTQLVFGFTAILGHNYPYFGFRKGGKGIATSFGVFLAISPKIFLLVVLLWIGLVGVTKYSSIGSLGAMAAAPVLMVYFGSPLLHIIFAFLAAALAFHRHRENIERLASGQELRIDHRTLGE